MRGKTIKEIIKEIKGEKPKDIEKWLYDNEYMPSKEQIEKIKEGLKRGE